MEYGQQGQAQSGVMPSNTDFLDLDTVLVLTGKAFYAPRCEAQAVDWPVTR
jgi:hypothetical protein